MITITTKPKAITTIARMARNKGIEFEKTRDTIKFKSAPDEMISYIRGVLTVAER